jgi:hypothetical protein
MGGKNSRRRENKWLILTMHFAVSLFLYLKSSFERFYRSPKKIPLNLKRFYDSTVLVTERLAVAFFGIFICRSTLRFHLLLSGKNEKKKKKRI